MSGTVCCYAGCKKSYSTDKDTSFFKFPDDPKRRKKWMQNSGNTELESLPERQLRGKRICSDHFPAKSFQTKTALNDTAVPNVAKVATPGKPPPPSTAVAVTPSAPSKKVEAASQKRGRGRASMKPSDQPDNKESPVAAKEVTSRSATPAKRRKLAAESEQAVEEEPSAKKKKDTATKPAPEVESEKERASPTRTARKSLRNAKPEVTKMDSAAPADSKPVVVAKKSAPPPVSPEKRVASPRRGKGRQSEKDKAEEKPQAETNSVPSTPEVPPPQESALKESESTKTTKQGVSPEVNRRKSPSGGRAQKPAILKKTPTPLTKVPQSDSALLTPAAPDDAATKDQTEKVDTGTPTKRGKGKKTGVDTAATPKQSTPASAKESKAVEPEKPPSVFASPKPKAVKKDLKQATATPKTTVTVGASSPATAGVASALKPIAIALPKESKDGKLSVPKPAVSTVAAKQKSQVASAPTTPAPGKVLVAAASAIKSPTSGAISAGKDSGVTVKKLVKKKAKPQDTDQQSKEAAPSAPPNVTPDGSGKLVKKRKLNLTTPTPGTKSSKADQETAKIIADQVSQMQSVLLPSNSMQRAVTKVVKPIMHKVEISDNVSEDSYDEYVYFDRDFEETFYDEDADGRMDREFERFYGSLKKFLRLSGKWTMGGVQWDPQGKRKVIIISEPEIPPNGRPSVKRCLQFFEDKAIRVFIDGMDMTDVFGMSCYAEKEDVAALICRVAEASSCCGVPEMVVDDLSYFPNARKRNTSYFDSDCPGVIPNDSYDPMCTACKQLQELVLENRKKERQRLLERRLRSEDKNFEHPFGIALYSMFSDLVDETDPTKPKKKRTKETFFRKYLHDTRYKMDGDNSKTERVYIEKPISVDSVSASFQDIVSKLGFNMPNSKRPKTYGSALSRSSFGPSTSTPKPVRTFPGSSGMMRMERRLPLQHHQVEHVLPFSSGFNPFTLDDGQEYELIGEVDSGGGAEIVEMKPTPSQQQYEIIEVDDETLAKLASAKNSVVVLPESVDQSNLQVTRINANDPNLSQILKAINTSHSYKVN